MKKVLLLLCLVLLVGCTSNEEEHKEKVKEANKKIKEYNLSNELNNYDFEDYDINSFNYDYHVMMNFFAEGSADVDVSSYILYENKLNNEKERSINLRYNNFYDDIDFELVAKSKQIPEVLTYIYKKRVYVSNGEMKHEIENRINSSIHGNFYWLKIKPEYVVSSKIATIDEGRVYFVELVVERENIEDFFTEYSQPFTYNLFEDKVEIIFETDDNLKIKRILVKYCDDVNGAIYEENQEFIINSYDYQELNIPSDIEEWEYREIE